MVISIGHDIIDISRIRAVYERYQMIFIQKVYTDEEIRYCFSRGNPFPSLAARFAAKEAVSKAFGCGIGRQLHWKSISVINDSNGKPNVQLDKLGMELIRKFRAKQTHLSLSHTQKLASAVAILTD